MFQLIFIITIVVAVIVLGPIATIWSLNTLFPVLAIPYSLNTWLATFVLFAGVTGLGFTAKK